MAFNNKKSKNIPAFLLKLHHMLQDEINQCAIAWSPNGVGFIILNEQILTKQLLPKYFKHSNYSSFIRQLNMYDFHKIRKGNIDNYFHHDKFIKGDLSSVAEIRRKPERKKALNLKNISSVQRMGYNQRVCSESEIFTNKKHAPQANKTQVTLNSVHTIKPKSEESIILMRENVNLLLKAEPIYYEQCESNHQHHFSQIDLNRGDSYQNQEQHNQQSDESSKMSINNEIQSKYIIEHQPKQILIPSHNNIFHFINPYQFANFGLFM